MDVFVTNLVFVIVIVISLVFVYIAINLYDKVVTLERQLDELASMEEDVKDLITQMLIKFTTSYAKIKRVDRLGAFESDDEVGFIFDVLKESIADLRESLQSIDSHLSENSEVK